MKKIYIIGAGAIGKALAVFLSQAGRHVELLRSSVDNLPSEIKAFEVILNGGAALHASVSISTLNSHTALDGVIVVASKAFANAALASAIRGKAGKSPIVILQNGLNIEAPFVTEGFTDVFRCVLFSTSQAISDTVVRFKPVSPSPIGTVSGSGHRAPEIAALLNTPHFEFTAVANIQPIIWTKVIANCVFNSICPLLDADNGIFYRDENAQALAVSVVRECVNVAKYAGVILKSEDVIDTILKISRSSDGQLISTLQDIRNKRPTEIDSLNFAVVAIARELGHPQGAPFTNLLGELVRLKSKFSSHP